MEDFKILTCRLCFTIIEDEDYKVVEDHIKNSLVDLLKLDFDDSKYVMCNVCSGKLFATLKFKEACLHTDKSINQYVDDTTLLPVDLKEICVKDKLQEGITNDTKVCRLCMQPISNASEFISINEEQVEMILKIVSEMNVFIIREPVMCNLCFDSLTVHCNFLKKCSDMEQNIGSISNMQIPDVSSPLPLLDTTVKIEDVDIKFEDGSELIETQYIDTNYEGSTGESEIHGHETSLDSVANYATKSNHMSMDKDPLEVKLYKCKDCNYETKYKSSLTRHTYVHKDPSEVQMYKCELCNYETKHKRDLKVHGLTHKDPSEMPMQKCEKCNFETKYKKTLKMHLLMHTDSPTVPMYKCELCSYVTRLKLYLMKHMLIHNDTSQAKTYKCETCKYSTNYKSNFNNHMLLHKDPEEVQIYVCQFCNYETKNKEYVKRHMLTHKDRSEMQTYKCVKCNFETKYKKNLVSHMLMHKDPSEVQKYKCDACNYETIAKGNLKKHMVIHKDLSEVEMYKCENCDYSTKYKSNMKSHVRHKHKT